MMRRAISSPCLLAALQTFACLGVVEALAQDLDPNKSVGPTSWSFTVEDPKRFDVSRFERLNETELRYTSPTGRTTVLTRKTIRTVGQPGLAGSFRFQVEVWTDAQPGVDPGLPSDQWRAPYTGVGGRKLAWALMLMQVNNAGEEPTFHQVFRRNVWSLTSTPIDVTATMRRLENDFKKEGPLHKLPLDTPLSKGNYLFFDTPSLELSTVTDLNPPGPHNTLMFQQPNDRLLRHKLVDGNIVRNHLTFSTYMTLAGSKTSFDYVGVWETILAQRVHGTAPTAAVRPVSYFHALHPFLEAEKKVAEKQQDDFSFPRDARGLVFRREAWGITIVDRRE